MGRISAFAATKIYDDFGVGSLIYARSMVAMSIDEDDDDDQNGHKKRV